MRMNWHPSPVGRVGRRGFTLIELLVVVAVIAVLISILLPALSNARKSAQATKCAANMHDVGVAFSTYLAENNATYPPSYVYPKSFQDVWDPREQPSGHPYGYMHWSYFLYNKGAVAPDVFTCPSVLDGGAPRTNPGPRDEDWEVGQRDQQGPFPGSGVTDRQAPRMAYTPNACVVPRNKFTRQLVQTAGGGDFINKFVKEHEIKSPRGVILVTEWSDDWFNVSVQDGQGSHALCKSHRAVSPLWSRNGEYNEYDHGDTPPYAFRYGPSGTASTGYGLLEKSKLEGRANIVSGDYAAEINAVGRHHPGRDKFGGSTNFLYIDGHAERKFLHETLELREWGAKYYSVTGRWTDVYMGSYDE